MNIVGTLGQRMRGQDDSAADNLVFGNTGQSNYRPGAATPRSEGGDAGGGSEMLIVPQTFDWQAGVAENDRAWLVDKPGRTRALTSSRTLAVFGGNNTSGERSVATSLTARPTGRLDFETENFVCGAQSATHGGPDDNSGQANHLIVGALSSHSKAHGHAMTTQQAAESGHLVAATLNSGGNQGGFRTEPGEHLVLAFTERTRAHGRALEAQEDLSYALTNPGEGGRTQERTIAGSFGVRRLTPRECERLQGFPDDWTAWGVDEQGNHVEMSDTARYRMIGNAVCRAVSAWLDQHILAVYGAAGG